MARTLDECRRRGWRPAIVERFVHRHLSDAFGFGDVLVIDGQPGALMVQCTSNSHVASRVAKIRTECAEAASAWLSAGNRIEVWGWAKKGASGKRKLWTLRAVPVTADDFDE